MFKRLNRMRTSAACLAVLAFFVAWEAFSAALKPPERVRFPEPSWIPASRRFPAPGHGDQYRYGIEHQYTTNSSGLYVAPFLQPGHYKIVDGKPRIRPRASQRSDAAGGTDAHHRPESYGAIGDDYGGGSSATPILDVERTEVSQVVDQQIIQNLPVNGRNWSNSFCSRRTWCRTAAAAW